MSKINDYAVFVDSTTSIESKDYLAFIARASDLQASEITNVPRILTSAIGMLAESGEFAEIMKK